MSNQAVDLFSQFATDETAEEIGVETLLPGAGSTMFKIARAFNPTYRRLLKKLYKPHEALIKTGSKEGEAKAIEVEIELMSRSVLVGWNGTVRVQGVDLEYSVNNAKKLLALKEFRAVVDKFSNDPDNYKMVKTEDDEKNSEPTSTGTSDGAVS